MITATTMIGIVRNRIVRLPSDLVNWLQPWDILYAVAGVMVALSVINALDSGRHFTVWDVLVPILCLAYAGVLVWIAWNRRRKEAHEAN